MNLFRLFALVAPVIVHLWAPAAAAAQPAAVVFDPADRLTRFAAEDIIAQLSRRSHPAVAAGVEQLDRLTQPIQIVLTTVAASVPDRPAVQLFLSPQGYAIRREPTSSGSRWWAIGADSAGAMYGGLELAEAIGLPEGLEAVADRQVTPYLARRGIKFNIPLDARTPSYSDDSTSAQANIDEMWRFEFWTEFLDAMARDRYNFLSLWSLSPFPSLVRVPEYPNVALADVKKRVGPLWDATLQGRGMYDAGWELETVRTMTIDEKIAFWRRVMQHAHDRGIEVAIFTWNTFVYGTEASGYGITAALDNRVTRDYVRRSVRALFNTYPLLSAIGVTAGENMGNEQSGAAVKEEWLWETYGLGVQDAIVDARDPAGPYYRPGRVIRLIHRAHQSDLQEIVRYFRQLPGYDAPESTLAFSFKYSQAHMHSSTKPLFIYENGWFETIPPGKKTWLTVRNDDMYYLRWGDPDYVRQYWTSLPDLSKIAGFYLGPDGYTWGRENWGREDFRRLRSVSENPPDPNSGDFSARLFIHRMWYSFLLWGRLAFEPSLPNDHFRRILAARYPEASSDDLFAGWAAVSKIVPLVTRFYWGSLDFRWYPEACWSLAGFASVQDFITPKFPPMSADEDGQRPLVMSVKAFVDGEPVDGRLTPLQVADLLDGYADEGLRRAERALPSQRPAKPSGSRSAGPGPAELDETLTDIRAMAWLGRYYAAKIRGAVALHRHQIAGGAGDHMQAREYLRAAASHWHRYAELWSRQYRGQVLTRMGLTRVDIAAIQTFVDRDVPPPLDR